jgi:hypothetical protein
LTPPFFEKSFSFQFPSRSERVSVSGGRYGKDVNSKSATTTSMSLSGTSSRRLLALRRRDASPSVPRALYGSEERVYVVSAVPVPLDIPTT